MKHGIRKRKRTKQIEMNFFQDEVNLFIRLFPLFCYISISSFISFALIQVAMPAFSSYFSCLFVCVFVQKRDEKNERNGSALKERGKEL